MPLKTLNKRLKICTPYNKEDSRYPLSLSLTPCHLLCGRSILAMASTVKTSLQTRIISPKCGLKSGLDGKSHMLLLDRNLELIAVACGYYLFVLTLCVNFTGIQNLVGQFLLDLHRTWHFQLQGLFKMVVLLPTTTWYLFAFYIFPS